jgi:hypothetical protein
MATPTTSVPGIGKASAFALAQHGIRSAEELAAADAEALSAVPGFGANRAAAAIGSARKLIASTSPDAGQATVDASKGGAPRAGKAKAKSSGKEKKKKRKKKEKDKKPGKGKKKSKKKT